MDPPSREQLVAKVLKEELREDDNTREQSLEQFRDWILKHPDIRDCPTDDSFLLSFLRVRKHSVPMAEQSLFNLLKYQHNFPSFSSDLDIEDPDINDIISNGHLFPSPYRDSNHAVMVYIIASANFTIPLQLHQEVQRENLDIAKHSYQSVLRAILLTCLGMVRMEDAQIFGCCAIFDFGQVTPAYVTFYPVTVIKTIMAALEKAVAIRCKKWHVINLSPVTTFLIKMMVSGLSEKLQKRFLFHSSLEELHQHIDPSVLPKEYGGTMPMDEMIGLWKKDLAEHRESILALNNTKLVGDSYKNDLGSNATGIPGQAGSFRTLAVD